MPKRGAQGNGTIRQRPDGRWEARYVVGNDPGTGKQIRKSIYGDTQKEVRQKLNAVVKALDEGTYFEPTKITVGQWLDIWTAEYLGAVKPMTVVSYTGTIKNHIKPALGAVKLDALTAPIIQKFYNSLGKETAERAPLSAKTVKNVHGIFHKALQQAVVAGLMRFNPADGCALPRVEKKEIVPLDEVDTTSFLAAIEGHKFETVLFVDLFTGMRLGEILALRWEDVNLSNGTITIRQQLQRPKKRGEPYCFASLKNDKPRQITPAPIVIKTLKAPRAKQAEMQLAAGRLWERSGLVFTDELGHFLPHHVVYKQFKAVVKGIGLPDARFHDLRHSYAVASIRAGDDIKTVQGNLGHATASFTLDIYGHVTEQMKQASANRMQSYFESLKTSKG